LVARNQLACAIDCRWTGDARLAEERIAAVSRVKLIRTAR
jgi:hypothetical protein